MTAADLRSMPERFHSKVSISDGGCWEWTGGYRDRGGYGRYYVGGSPKEVMAHRYAFESLVGPIPDGLDLDHLCRNRGCCNPAHLEAVSRRENLMRSPFMGPAWGGGINKIARTHCKHGHEYTPENTRIYRTERVCRACDRARNPMRKARAAEKASS